MRERQGIPLPVMVGGGAIIAGQLGVGVTMVLMQRSYTRIETLKAPTPKDLATDVHRSLLPTTIGLFVSGIGAAIVLGWLLRRALRGGS